QHDLPMKLLDRHSVAHKEVGQVFEQFGMNGPFAVEPKIARRVYNARAKMPFPDAIHYDPHRQRLAQNRFSQFLPPAALCKTQSTIRREHRKEPTWNDLA